MLEKLIGDGWAPLIGEEFEKSYFIELIENIRESKTRTQIYPDNIEDTLAVFRNTNPDSIKVVIVGQDPYHDGSYDGRAFSNHPWTTKLSPSLTNILKEVKADVYDGWDIKQSPSLIRWEKQGVFLINRVLTVEKGNPNSHKGLGWEIFTGNAIARLSEHRSNIVFMLWGGEAFKSKKFILNQENHLILTASHPSPLSANQGGWFGCKHFSQANDYLLKHNRDFIEW